MSGLPDPVNIQSLKSESDQFYEILCFSILILFSVATVRVRVKDTGF